MEGRDGGRPHYVHRDIPGLETRLSFRGKVSIVEQADPPYQSPLRIAHLVFRLAERLGIAPPPSSPTTAMPYGDEGDTLLFDADLLSDCLGVRVRLLRGWKHFESCIKGFNALGLLVEQGWRQADRLERSPAALERARRAYLRSRRDARGEPVFGDDEVATLGAAALDAVDPFEVGLWCAFAARPVICSTSSNMGVSLHEALRGMQRPTRGVLGRRYGILNADEGALVIWCPDEAADFMSTEKAEQLRALEAEAPPLTRLRTYINRRERDPGALSEALTGGGYFFPTNPQSTVELQNLLSSAIDSMAREADGDVASVLAEPNVAACLDSLDCVVDGEFVTVTRPLQTGMLGMVVPYLVMLEESLRRGDTPATSTLNQASIAAALSAAVIADGLLRTPERVSADDRRRLRPYLPHLMDFLDSGKSLGRDLPTVIHGVFDIANLQSLAQLFGVQVVRHYSGRGTAFVGLGSSSYASGNLCYGILRGAAASGGAFRGESTLHPATHALNPVAQALVFGNEMLRVMDTDGFAGLAAAEQIARVQRHATKPEPAGAASLAGYLLARLDASTLSLIEIAHAMRRAGFDRLSFLEFAGFGGADLVHRNAFIQEAHEEGPSMGQLAQNLLILLDWDLERLEALTVAEAATSARNYRSAPFNPPEVEARSYALNLYITGDNTRQPSETLCHRLIRGATEARSLAAATEQGTTGALAATAAVTLGGGGR